MSGSPRDPASDSNRSRSLLAIAIGLVLVTTLLAGAAFAWRFYAQARQHAIDSLASVSALKTAELDRWLEETRTHLAQPPSSMIATTFAAWLKSGRRPGPAQDRLLARFAYLQRLAPEHGSIRLFDPEGRLALASAGAVPHSAAGYASIMEKALASRQPVMVDFHREGDEVVLELLAPMFLDNDGELRPAGFLLYELRPQAYLYPMLDNWPTASPSAESILYRIDGDQAVILNPLRHDPAAPLTKRLSVAAPDLLLAQGARGAGPTLFGVDYRGIPAVGVVSRLTAAGWYLLVKLDDAEIFAEARQMSLRLAMGVALAMVLLLALGLSVLRQLRERAGAARLQAEVGRLRAAQALFSSEARYRAIVDSQSWEICRWKPDTTLTYVNSAFALARATPAEKLVGQRWLDFVSPADRPGLEAMIAGLLAGERSVPHEHPVAVADGKEAWMSWTDTPLYGSNGEIAEFQSIGIDFTERRRVELALQESERRLALALEAAREGLWDWDLPSGRLYLSPTYYAMLGYGDGEFPAAFGAWAELLHPDDLAPLLGELGEELERDDFQQEFRLRAKDGGWRWVVSRGKVVERDGEGIQRRIIGIAMDISKQRALEAERRLLYETIAAARNEIYLIDGASHRFRFVNQGALDNLGFSLEEMREKTPLDLAPYETDASFGAFIAPLLRGEKAAIKMRVLHRRADATLYPAEVHLQHIRHRDDAYFLAIVEDLTERESQEAALRESEGRFHTIFDSIDEGIFIQDEESGAILAVNRRACQMYGRSEAELLTASVLDLSEGVPPYSQFEAIEWMTKAASGQPQTFEWHARNKAGELFWVEVSQRLATIGENERLLSVVRDISVRKAQEDELRRNLERQVQLNRKLEEAQGQLLQSEKMASIGQLAAGVAHELNNPIGFVHSNLGTLENYLRDIFEIADAYAAAEKAATCRCAELDRVLQLKQEKEYDYLRDDIFQLMAESKDGLARVRKIVQDLKDFSRVGEAEWQWADLHKGIDSTLNIVWNELKYKCKVVKEYGELPEVYCLPSQLNQVFMNLLVNAGHAIESKGQITIRTGAKGEAVWVSVSDTGKGIPRENLNRIFEPFFTTKPVGQGTGLGLSLAYSIVQKHRGRIEVESQVGVGTTFRVVLPVKPVEKASS